MKDHNVFKTLYKDNVFIKEEKLPVCTHQTQGFVVDSARILAAGYALRDGKKVEFQDVRIYFSRVEP